MFPAYIHVCSSLYTAALGRRDCEKPFCPVKGEKSRLRPSSRIQSSDRILGEGLEYIAVQYMQRIFCSFHIFNAVYL